MLKRQVVDLKIRIAAMNCCLKSAVGSDVSKNTLSFIKKAVTAVRRVSSSSSSFEGHPLQVRHKQDWGRGFILLLPQTAALPGSHAGSDIIKPASSFVIQNCQTSCSMWCSMYRALC